MSRFYMDSPLAADPLDRVVLPPGSPSPLARPAASPRAGFREAAFTPSNWLAGPNVSDLGAQGLTAGVDSQVSGRFPGGAVGVSQIGSLGSPCPSGACGLSRGDLSARPAAASRAQRGFSFSLQDAHGLERLPFHKGTVDAYDQPPMSTWNPLDGVRRNWVPMYEENRPMAASSFSTDRGLPIQNMVGQSHQAEDLQRQLFSIEGRAQTLRAKISHLESGLAGQAVPMVASQQQVFLKITVPQPLENGKLGLVIKDLHVAAVTDPRAMSWGWALGDRVLAVNGVPVSSTADFARQLSRAMSAYTATGSPLAFDISRGGASQQPPVGGCCGGVPIPSGLNVNIPLSPIPQLRVPPSSACAWDGQLVGNGSCMAYPAQGPLMPPPSLFGTSIRTPRLESALPPALAHAGPVVPTYASPPRQIPRRSNYIC